MVEVAGHMLGLQGLAHLADEVRSVVCPRREIHVTHRTTVLSLAKRDALQTDTVLL